MIRRSERRRTPRRRVSVSDREGVPVFSVGGRAVWDAGDLARLAVAIERVVGRGGGRHLGPRDAPAVAIDMAGATGLPAGFWDRLCRWTEQGFRVLLLDPEPEVRTMRWFGLSARALSGEDLGRVFELRGVPRACGAGGPAGRVPASGSAADGGRAARRGACAAAEAAGRVLPR